MWKLCNFDTKYLACVSILGTNTKAKQIFRRAFEKHSIHVESRHIISHWEQRLLLHKTSALLYRKKKMHLQYDLLLFSGSDNVLPKQPP